MSHSNLAVLTKSHNIVAAKKRARKDQIKEVVFDEVARRYEFLPFAILDTEPHTEWYGMFLGSIWRVSINEKCKRRRRRRRLRLRERSCSDLRPGERYGCFVLFGCQMVYAISTAPKNASRAGSSEFSWSWESLWGASERCVLSYFVLYYREV